MHRFFQFDLFHFAVGFIHLIVPVAESVLTLNRHVVSINHIIPSVTDRVFCFGPLQNGDLCCSQVLVKERVERYAGFFADKGFNVFRVITGDKIHYSPS